MADNHLFFYNSLEGTSQQTRLDKNLLPESFHIDDRSTGDLVKFAVEFSKSLNYFNLDSAVTLSWHDFFIKERYIFLYIIADTNLYPVQKSFYQTYELITNLTEKNDIHSHLQGLILPIHQILDILADWNSSLGLNNIRSNDDLIGISKFIQGEDICKGILKIYQLSEQLDLAINWDGIIRNFSLVLYRNPEQTGAVVDPGGLDDIKKIFNDIYLFTRNVIKIVNSKLDEVKVSNQDVSPHMALFLGFLKIYSILQSKINGITRRHLDYYFSEVLGLKRKGMSPDETYVRFELNKEIDSLFIEKGTAVSGSKDNSGSPIVYQAIHDQNLTDVKIKGLYTLFVSQNRLNYTGINDGGMITDVFCKKHDVQQIGSMKIFGEDQFYKAASEKTMEIAPIGFIIASEILTLSEGERRLSVEFAATRSSYLEFLRLIGRINENKGFNSNDSEYTFYQIFNTAFVVFIVMNGIETRFERYKIHNRPEINGISVEMLLNPEDPAITPLKKPEIENQPTIDKPYVKLLLQDECHIYAYSLLQMLDIVNIKVHVEVIGIKNLVLFNNYGQLDHSAPFQLFGAVPKLNSYFLLGSPELFSKPLKNIDIHINWYQLPPNPDGWKGYFAGYDEEILNSDYQVEIEYLNKGTWSKLESISILPLFEEEKNRQLKINKLSNHTHFNSLKLNVDPSISKESDIFKPYTLKSRNGYLKIELISPEFAFGFNAYPKNLYKSIKENSKLPEDGNTKELNLPVSPIVKSISVNYTAETEALNEKGPKDTIQLYCLGPTGYVKSELKSAEKPVKLFIDLEPEGHLMIGLDKYPVDGIMSFFFNPILSTVSSDNRNVPTPKWQFLKDNTWVDMPENSLIIDNTKNFLQSGIISIRIPESINNKNTLINDDLFWIKATVDKNADIAPEIIGIYTNVVRVKWNGESDGSHLNNFKPDDSINRMQVLNPKILRIEQLLEPFNGKHEEARINYYVRVSERLRHKNRAYTAWDYERLLLMQFPVIFKAKCFNSIRYSKNTQEKKRIVEPGEILIAVTPDVTSPLVTDKLKPRFGVNFLLRMQDYLEKISSPFIKIKVINAHYEMIRVICKVKTKGVLNSGYYIDKLNRDLVEFLTPWANAGDIDEQFGNSQYKSKIMSFVSQREYIDFVTSFSIVKTNTERGNFELFDTASEGDDQEDVIYPEFPWSILTSVDQHDISVLNNNNYQDPIPRGIDSMKLGVDFGIINKD